MDLFAILATLGWFLHRQERREMYGERCCLWCPKVVHWNGRIWVHPDGKQYAIKPSRVEGVHPSSHPAIPDRSPMGVL